MVARQRYAPEHPDVKALERLVAGLSQPLATPDATSSSAPKQDEPDNPAYIQLRTQLDASKSDRASLQRKRTDLAARVAMLEGRLANTPGVERDYMVMARELDSTQLRYREVRQKQMDAQIAQSLETERKGERFTLIDPPVAPEEPDSPNRKLILALGLMLALGLSVGIAVLLEATDQRIHGRNEIASLLAVPPLAVIPWLQNAAQRAAQLRRQRFALYGSIAAFALAIVAIHTLYRPLDVLWAVAMRRLGS